MSRHKAEAASCRSECCLRVENLGVTLGGRTVLEGINLHMHCGEIAAVIGPNGAGKSTLIKSLLGAVPHTGSVEFARAGDRLRPQFGYVPQAPSMLAGEPVSVYDLFCASSSRYPVFLPIPGRLRRRALESLARVGAEEMIDKRVGDLSGGELQRVLIALAMTPLPHVLMLDEPLSGVDALGGGLLRGLLKQIVTEYDLSILLVTHDFDTLPEYADRVLLINRTLRLDGAPRAVLGSEAFAEVFHMCGRMD